MICDVPSYNTLKIKKLNDLVAKNGIDIIFEYFQIWKLLEHAAFVKKIYMASSEVPLSIDMLGSSRGLELQKVEKNEKMKNRHLIQIPFIN